jgi:CheY-like chemotaxis protein
MPRNKSILVVDDEKNIRLTMSQSLEPLGMPVQTAVNGEEALLKLSEDRFGLVFLDLKMPGIDGLEVLRRIKEKWPKIRVIIITAYATVELAVEAMKLGAVDFVEKPFSPGEIRDLANQVLEREALDEASAVDYRTLIEITKRHITDRNFATSLESARRAVAADPGQPEAYNLLGALFEIKGDRSEAEKFYRATLDIAPSYKPAQANLERITSLHKLGRIDLGPAEDETESRESVGESDKNEK